MSINNVKLWFAKDNSDQIVTIDEIDEENKNNTYLCPMCGSIIIPKATTSVRITSHFAHVDASKCSPETMMHWWFKNKLLEKGDKFSVVSDKEKSYICFDIQVEQEYELVSGTYRPDATITTECGSVIYFEIRYTNKKKIEEYIDMWLELKNTVVEIDINTLMKKDVIPSFNALFYDGKCFNTNKNDVYYHTIGKYKEAKLYGEVDSDLKDRIKKLDWLWSDVLKYRKGERDINYMVDLIDCIEGEERKVVYEILEKPKCVEILNRYVQTKTNEIFVHIINFIKNKYDIKYIEYIKKEIIDNKKPNRLKGYIKLSGVFWNSYDVDRYSKEELLSILKKEIEYTDNYLKNKEIMDTYNEKAELIEDEMLNHELYSNYIQNLTSARPDYRVSVSVRNMRKNSKEVLYELSNDFTLNVRLERKRYECTNFQVKVVDNEFTASNVIQYVKNKIEHYFDNLRPIKNIDKLNLSIKQLNQKYSDIKLEISGDLQTEESYCIWFSSPHLWREYFILTNNEIGEIDEQDIRSLISEKIENKIKEKLIFECYDCDKDFNLEIGELRFFIKKGFNLPSRCKDCRKLKKKKTL